MFVMLWALIDKTENESIIEKKRCKMYLKWLHRQMMKLGETEENQKLVKVVKNDDQNLLEISRQQKVVELDKITAKLEEIHEDGGQAIDTAAGEQMLGGVFHCCSQINDKC